MSQEDRAFDDGCLQCCGGPPFRIQYSDTGEPLKTIPISAYKRNGLQDNIYTDLGVSRRICKTDVGPCCCTQDKKGQRTPHVKLDHRTGNTPHPHEHRDKHGKKGRDQDKKRESWVCDGGCKGKEVKQRVLDDSHVARTVYNKPGCDGQCSWKTNKLTVPIFGGCMYKDGCQTGQQDDPDKLCPCCRSS